MAIKKTELYSSLWKMCDELRGGMDASQYKDYVLTLLFMKYVSDKYAGDKYATIVVPEGATFSDMASLAGDKEIGDKINKIIGKLAEANDLKGVIDVADFNDEDKLGKGKDMVERLSKLLKIFDKIDLRSNKADGDDLLGDAYEYLMRHFATESGKSKGQFYTPSEVSRVLAKVVGIGKHTRQDETVYDPACGSGSLLLKAADQAPSGQVSLYGQEKDSSTFALARMNTILHNNPGAEIIKDDTITSPYWKDSDGNLKRFDYVVANPPFSLKSWSSGINVNDDDFKRFEYGIPPEKNGDYAFLLHILKSLKSTGKAAVILPHGVLFRGNVEADIRRNIIKQGYIKGVIGLPANLFYGTGIPACIIVLDKGNAQTERSIFMVDASRGFIKDGNKNRLREMDIHKIVDVFNKQSEFTGFSRLVSYAEIEKNEFNLNIPRYIDSDEQEELQDIEGHLLGGIPKADIESLSNYWTVFPSLKESLFIKTKRSDKYYNLAIDKNTIKSTIFDYPEFNKFIDEMDDHLSTWQQETVKILKAIKPGFHPKELIHQVSESLLAQFSNKPLINQYHIYQYLMDYWFDTMQDDCYLIAQDGWQAKTSRVIETKKGKQTDKGWTCELIPKELVINRYFNKDKTLINELHTQLESLESELAELEEEHGGEEGALNNVSKKAEAEESQNEYIELAWASLHPESCKQYKELKKQITKLTNELANLISHQSFNLVKNNKGKVTTKLIKARLNESVDSEEASLLNQYLDIDTKLKSARKELKAVWQQGLNIVDKAINNSPELENINEITVIRQYLSLTESITGLKKSIKEKEVELDEALLTFYPTLTEEQVKQLVVDDKWMTTIRNDIHGEMDKISQHLASRVKELIERYETPLPNLTDEVERLEKAVNGHLESMGFVWN